MIRQRLFALTLDYEDLNDHDQLRSGPLLGLMAGKADSGTELLAGKGTPNRIELGHRDSDALQEDHLAG
jgi:hypothetical protein